MSTKKLVTLEQLGLLATRCHEEDEALATALGARIDEVVADVEGLVTAGGEPNVLEGVKVNGTALTIADKMVDILIETGSENGTISVAGANVAIKGLASLAFKSEITEAELGEALKAAIAGKATQADFDLLTVRVGNLENAGYQNAEQVQTAIQTAIAASGHAHFEEVDAVPSAADAEENVMYLVMNDETNHYDIYAKVGDAVVLLDDTTVDLSAYAKTTEVTAAIQGAITGLNIDQYATDTELNAAIERIAAVEALFDSYYTKTEIDAMFANYYTKEQAEAKFLDESEGETVAQGVVDANTAADADVNSMITEKFGAAE